ncbi:glycoside hydrolase family 5 protein [Rubellimicrobium sp. CFH 75288]|uniref:glycoside hydrolase family 5 protein n=1 Tax=Rubellimicrobium sp. CFH 75288 TaxID=2697034 RepID=UPI001FB62B88|nr:glycoside hydrolase family 5 protein [Rubellimicrobium sp. CFH 75288]
MQDPVPFPVRRGISLGNTLDAPCEGDWGPPVSDGDLRWIAQAGFDTVRLPVRFAAHWDGRVRPSLMNRVEQIVEAVLSLGLNVILDLHHFDALMEDPERYGPVAAAIWAEIADRFRGAPDGLIFELLNEPRGRLGAVELQRLWASLLAVLRPSHPDRWIVLGGPDHSAAEQVAALPRPGPRIALTFHFYEPFAFTHQQADWLPVRHPRRGWGTPQERAALEAAIARAARTDGPVLLGEFGVTEAAPPAARRRWIEAVRRAAEAHGMGWCHWALRAGFGVLSPGTHEWRPGLRAALMDG